MGSLHYSVGQPTQGLFGQVTVQRRLHVKSPTWGAHDAPWSVPRPLPAGSSSAPAHIGWVKDPSQLHMATSLAQGQSPSQLSSAQSGPGANGSGSPYPWGWEGPLWQPGHLTDLPTETTGVLRQRRPRDWAANSISDPASRSLGWAPS